MPAQKTEAQRVQEVVLDHVRESLYTDHAVGEMASLGRPAVPYLLQALNDKRSTPIARRNAVEALGKIRSPEAVPAMINALQDEHAWVRAVAPAAIMATGAIALPALFNACKLQPELRPIILPILSRIAGAGSKGIREQAFPLEARNRKRFESILSRNATPLARPSAPKRIPAALR